MVEDGFCTALIDQHAQGASAIGLVKPTKKLGDDDSSFMVATLHDGTIGNVILSALGGSSYYNARLAPC